MKISALIYRTVSAENSFLQAAKKAAENFSTDQSWPVGAVLVRRNVVIVSAGNRVKISPWWQRIHKKICIRKWFRIPSGRFYWLCPGCSSPAHHPEQQIVRYISDKKINPDECEIFLWGHYKCCLSCEKKLLEAGIKKITIVEDAGRIFSRKE